METTECSCRSEFQVAEESDALVQETMTRLRPHFRRQEAYQHAVDYPGGPHRRGGAQEWLAISGARGLPPSPVIAASSGSIHLGPPGGAGGFAPVRGDRVGGSYWGPGGR